jgi:pimeloyl-ACP methyl ester carboxylesterase
MRCTRTTAIFLVVLTTSFTAISCSPSPLPSADETVAALSGLILDPSKTCAQLRSDFGVYHLPLVDSPAEIGLEFEEHWVSTIDGAVLRVWYLPAELDRGTVVVSPGAAGTVPCFLFTGQLLVENGWSAVLYEYEGFGWSSGEPSLTALRPDLEAVVDWARARTGRGQVTLLGLSLGTIPSVAVAVERPDAVNAVVLDSPVALGAEIERFAFVLGGRAEELIAVLDPMLRSETIIDEMYQPLLVFSHEWDIVTPPETVDLLFELAPGPKDMLRFPQHEHARGQFHSTEAYSQYLDAFLSDVWPE